jgi:hypothetical protein
VIAPIVALMLATLPGPAVSGMVREVDVRAERILVVPEAEPWTPDNPGEAFYVSDLALIEHRSGRPASLPSIARALDAGRRVSADVYTTDGTRTGRVVRVVIGGRIPTEEWP